MLATNLTISAAAGSASTPSLAFTGDLNTGIYSPGADQVAVSTGGTGRLFVDASGRLLVGTSSARTNLYSTDVGNPTIQVEAAGMVGHWKSIISICNNSTLGAGPTLALIASGDNVIGAVTLVNNGHELGIVDFLGTDGAKPISAASIRAVVDGTPGTDDMPGRLVFSTTADGANSPTEALRITNDRVIAYNQPTPTSKSAAATLTITELKTGIVEYTGAAATLTLPTGTLMEGGFVGIYTNMAFEWSVINTGAGICTIGAGTAHTIVGSAAVAIGASARFVSRRTAANTFVSYRLS
jgi:hypothetical protein